MDSTDFYTTTPIHQRGYTNNTTPSRPDFGIEWTTKRCERLLRALTSRVAILTKDLARFSTSNQLETSSSRRIGEKNPPDGDWSRTKKKIKQTYSSKRNKCSNGRANEPTSQPADHLRRSLNPGEISVATPILARARREYSDLEAPSNSQLDSKDLNAGQPKRRRTNYALDGTGSSFQISESLQEIRRKTSATKYTTYEGIYSGLEALLVATAPTKSEVKRTGARSLFAMALRVVPGYIRQQESLVEAHTQETRSKSAIVNRDMATEIYDELEDFGLGHGWKHLRTVVRSHGIQVLGEAITAGILDADYVGCLITLCTRLSAMDEAQSLFSTLLSSTNFALPRSIYEKPNQSLFMLWKFTEHTESTTFQYRELSSLLRLGILPFEWCATRHFGQVWAGIFHTLSSGSDNFETLAFLDTLLPLISARINTESGVGNTAISEALNNTFSSVLTTLSSIAILGNGNQVLGSKSVLETTLGSSRCALSSLQNCSTFIPGQVENIGILPILSALFAMGYANIHVTSTLVDVLLTRLEQSKRHDLNSYSEAVLFTCSVARCCGRGTSSSGFEHLQHLHYVLEACNKDTNANILKSLIVDSAFSFAEQFPERDCFRYAAETDTKFCVRRLDTGSASHVLLDEGKQRSGYRWEEGIGEWVTASPLVVRKFPIMASAKEYMECDTPYRPAPARRQKLEVQVLPLRITSRPVVEIFHDTSITLEDYNVVSDFGSDEVSAAEQDLFHLSENDDELNLESSQYTVSNISDASFSSMEISNGEEPFVSTASSKNTKRYAKRATRADRRAGTNNSDWTTHDDSAISITSPNVSCTEKDVSRRMTCISTRLSCKVPRSRSWQVLDDSDDELSFVSVTSSQEEEKFLQEVTSTVANTRRACKRADKASLKTATKRRRVVASNSEDELCL